MATSTSPGWAYPLAILTNDWYYPGISSGRFHISDVREFSVYEKLIAIDCSELFIANVTLRRPLLLESKVLYSRIHW